MWEYCINSKLDMEEAQEEMDEVDNMRIKDFKRLEMIYSSKKSFPVSKDEVILDVFRFFKWMLNEEKQDKTELVDRMVEDDSSNEATEILSRA